MQNALLAALGLAPNANAHRAADDCHALARVLPRVLSLAGVTSLDNVPTCSWLRPWQQAAGVRCAHCCAVQMCWRQCSADERLWCSQEGECSRSCQPGGAAAELSPLTASVSGSCCSIPCTGSAARGRQSAAPAASAAVAEVSADHASSAPAAEPAAEPAAGKGRGRQRVKTSKCSLEPALAVSPPEPGGNTAEPGLAEVLSPLARECVQAWKAALQACRDQGHPLTTPLSTLCEGKKPVLLKKHKQCALIGLPPSASCLSCSSRMC